jgi:hypothetical protein
MRSHLILSMTTAAMAFCFAACRNVEPAMVGGGER